MRVTPLGGARSPIPDTWLEALQQRIAHRGPDGSGRYRDVAVRSDGSRVEVALVHARLSIIDLAGGAQPMVSERGPGGSGAVAVVFNGCVYNHRDLRKDLAAHGAEFQTDHSDTEVLLHAWRGWRDRFTDHLDGMYAAGIWDHDRGECVLIRDRAGEKPMYYTVFDEGRALVFSSSVRGVIDVRRMMEPGWSPELDGDAIVDWMRLGWSDALPFRDVFELEPRHTRVFPARSGGRGADVVHANAFPSGRSKTPSLTVDDMDRIISDAVATRLEADVPVGCFLSGGIDSSLISYYAKKHLGKLTTLCVRFPDERFDESPFADEVAAVLGTDHRVIDVQPAAAADTVRLIESVGLPFGDSSVLPTHWVCAAAKQEVKVALSGDGGDELCFGYRRYKAWLRVLKMQPVLLAMPRRWPRRLTRGGSRVARVVRLAESMRAMGYRSMLSWQLSDVLRIVPSQARRFSRMDPVFIGPSYDDLSAYLPFDLLRKGDTASMLVPIEVRAPLLRMTMIDACLSEPISSLMRNGELKGILRDLARRFLPPTITARPKQGFGLPVGGYFRNNFGGMRTLLKDALSGSEPFGRVHSVIDIDMDEVRKFIREHERREREHSAKLFGLLTLAIWAKSLR